MTSELEVIDPRTGLPGARAVRTPLEAIPGMVADAAAAQREWGRVPPPERVDALAEVVRAWRLLADHLVADVLLEVGQPERFTRTVHVETSLAGAAAMLDVARGVEWSRRVDASTVERVPIGVVGAITPWNYPLHQAIAKIVPALLAGCAVVVKPSELAPTSVSRLVDAAAQVLPRALVSTVIGEADAGAALVAGGVDAVSFTGSVPVGRAIAAAAGARGLPTTLELGGSSPAVVGPGLADDELTRVCRYVVADAMSNAGQTCNRLARLVVPRSRMDEVRQAVTTAAQRLSSAGLVGPVRTAAAARSLAELVERADATGHPVWVDGRDLPERAGFWFGPTVIVDEVGAAWARDEIFGPVLVVQPYDDAGADAGVDAAIEVAGRSTLSLSAAVWAGDPDVAERMADQLRVGQVRIAGAPFDHRLPFGGFGASGFGREWGREGIEAFTTTRVVAR